MSILQTTELKKYYGAKPNIWCGIFNYGKLREAFQIRITNLRECNYLIYVKFISIYVK